MKNRIIVLICIIISFSCSNKDSDRLNDNKIQVRTLQERDPNTPIVLSLKKTKTRVIQPRTVLKPEEYLGRSYKPLVIPVGSGENLFYPVLDLDKIKKDYPNYILPKRMGTSEIKSFAYSNFEKYVERSKTTQKVNSGFSFKLGKLFSIGAKNTMTKVFSSSLVNESQSVFGELDIMIKENNYSLRTSDYILKKLILDCQSHTFKDELYNTTPTELYFNYGGLVMTDFLTGGIAMAVYRAKSKIHESTETSEKDMNTEINTSYSWGKKDDDKKEGDSNFGIGKNFSSGKEINTSLTEVTTSVCTFGGRLGHASFGSPNSIDKINIDLSSWLTSFSDESVHNIIDISDNGLYPLSTFVLEKKFQTTI